VKEGQTDERTDGRKEGKKHFRNKATKGGGKNTDGWGGSNLQAFDENGKEEFVLQHVVQQELCSSTKKKQSVRIFQYKIVN
jgi:hypothetical protein